MPGEPIMTRRPAIRRLWPLTAVILACALLLPVPARATSALDCLSGEPDMLIKGCTELLKGPLAPEERARAYANRALGYSLRGWYGEAIADYDRSLAIVADNPVALNNRAWAYFRWGRPAQGQDDVEKSLRLDPTSDAAYDTRAHIRQSLGDPVRALEDYRRAILFGGARMTKMYQCGLTEQGIYKGPQDGIPNPELFSALEQCVKDTTCDPLPMNEQCTFGTS
jgi:tetratricopeptide (TPR) repeat protein